MESVAVDALFGSELPCSSTKPLVGHTLGAAGALEAAFCWLVLREARGRRAGAAAHCFDGVLDPALPALHLDGRRASAPRVRGPARVMTNSFGFGGNNCTLVLESRVSVVARVRGFAAWAPGLEDAAPPGRPGRRRRRPSAPRASPTRASCRRCCAAAARR